MHNFKIGNTVRRIAGWHAGMAKGDTAKISGFYGNGFYLEGYGDSSHTWSNFELVQDEKESTSAWLKENKWFIRTGSPEKSKLVQEWLFEHGYNWGYVGGVQYYKENYLTNTNMQGQQSGWIMHGPVHNSAQEITLEFETIVKSVKLPEIAPKKTEAQLKLEELQRTIEDAQRQIAELKEEI